MVVAGKRAQKAVRLGVFAGECGRVRDVGVRCGCGVGSHEHEIGHARDARGGLRGGLFQQSARRVQRQLRIGVVVQAPVGGFDAGRFGCGGDGQAVAAAGQTADESHVAAFGVGGVGVKRQHHRGAQAVADHGHAVLAAFRGLAHEAPDGGVERVGKMLGVRFAVVGERIERGAEGDDEHDVVRVHLLGAHGGGRRHGGKAHEEVAVGVLERGARKPRRLGVGCARVHRLVHPEASGLLGGVGGAARCVLHIEEVHPAVGGGGVGHLRKRLGCAGTAAGCGGSRAAVAVCGRGQRGGGEERGRQQAGADDAGKLREGSFHDASFPCCLRGVIGR